MTDVYSDTYWTKFQITQADLACRAAVFGALVPAPETPITMRHDKRRFVPKVDFHHPRLSDRAGGTGGGGASAGDRSHPGGEHAGPLGLRRGDEADKVARYQPGGDS